MIKRKIFNIFLLTFIIFNVISCRTVHNNSSNNNVLHEAKIVHSGICNVQGDPADGLIKENWPTGYRNIIESFYLYTFPYIPYFIYSNTIVYAKEALLFPCNLFVEYTSIQDDADDFIAANKVGYGYFYNNMWVHKRTKDANYLNMDEFSYSPTTVKVKK